MGDNRAGANGVIAKALVTEEVRERYAALGIEAAGSTRQEYGNCRRDDIVKMARWMRRRSCRCSRASLLGHQPPDLLAALAVLRQ